MRPRPVLPPSQETPDPGCHVEDGCWVKDAPTGKDFIATVEEDGHELTEAGEDF